jgi:hypothetical protein
MRNKVALPLTTIVVAVLVVVGFRASGPGTPTARTSGESAVAGGDDLPKGVTLRQIDGGSNYYAHISPKSAWMDQRILLGAWLEQPLTATEVKYDAAMGNNIYWNLAANPLDTKDCGGVQPCRVNFNVIRELGMHASAPDVTSESGSETVAYEGYDEADMEFGPGTGGWNPDGPPNESSCIPSDSPCGYTVAKFYYTGQPAKYGSTGYPSRRKPITQGYGKGVLFWESASQAKTFLKYSDTLSADSYWMTDPDLNLPSQGGCALLPDSPTACGNGAGPGLTTAERALPANYAYNVTRLQSLSGGSKPVTVDVETGCPGSNGECTTPTATTAAAWHALIAGARGIIWFQQNFSGHCADFNTFYDGSNPASPMYKCQQTPGVTIRDIVENVSSFNHEVASLNAVLLAPFAENYVSVGGADISVMAKYSKGVFYVFAAAGRPADPPANNQSVRFKLASDYTGPVTVINEHRVLDAVNGIFTDKFANANTVHIYKIGKLFRGPASCRQG